MGLAGLAAGACFWAPREYRRHEVHAPPDGRAVTNPTFAWLRDGVTGRAEVVRRLGRGTPLPPQDGAGAGVMYVWQSRPDATSWADSTVNRLVLRFDDRDVLLSHSRTATPTGGGR